MRWFFENPKRNSVLPGRREVHHRVYQPPLHRHDGQRGPQVGRPRGGGRGGEPGAEAEAVRGVRQDRAGEDHLRLQHKLAAHRRDRQGHKQAGQVRTGL